MSYQIFKQQSAPRSFGWDILGALANISVPSSISPCSILPSLGHSESMRFSFLRCSCNWDMTALAMTMKLHFIMFLFFKQKPLVSLVTQESFPLPTFHPFILWVSLARSSAPHASSTTLLCGTDSPPLVLHSAPQPVHKWGSRQAPAIRGEVWAAYGDRTLHCLICPVSLKVRWYRWLRARLQ